MAWVTDTYVQKWLSKTYVGDSVPTTVVQVRRGNWRRAYGAWFGFTVDAAIPGETADAPWRPTFTETTDWLTLPGVFSCEINKGLDQNGIPVATVVIENMAFVQQTGALGDVYRLIERGYLSPTRGYVSDNASRPAAEAQNEWYRKIGRQANVRIWQGLGAPELDGTGSPVESGGENGAWVFNGLIDDIDLTSAPARISMTARMGKLLTDSRIFGWNKSEQLDDPITFVSADDADVIAHVGDTPDSSSEQDGHSAAQVLTLSATDPVGWRSQTHSSDGVTEWVQVKIPAGTYSSLLLKAAAHQEVYIGVYLRSITDPATGGTTLPTVDGVEHAEGFAAIGLGVVPGTNGGWPFMAHISDTQTGQQTIDLGHTIVTGNDTTVRIGVRSLATDGSDFSAQVDYLTVRQFSLPPEGREWITVNDISDIVKVALRWAGFVEGDIEPAGTNIKGKWRFNRSNFLVDVVKKCQEATGFIFFVADPTTGISWGVPTFRRRRAINRDIPVVAEVRDTDLLYPIQVKLAEEPLAYIIRARGKEQKYGSSLGGDKTLRIMAVYRPPWTDGDPDHDLTAEMGGVIKHVVRTDPALTTLIDCEIACLLIAVEEALQAAAVTAEIPPLLLVELDDTLGLLDTATGTNSRMYVTSVVTTHQTGEDPRYDMTLQGVLIDTPELEAVLAAMDAINFDPEPAPHVVLSYPQPRSR